MPLSWNEMRLRAASFCADWRDQAPKAREEADAQEDPPDESLARKMEKSQLERAGVRRA
jgi:hypothetical protein